ncbi:ABC-type transport auxiliary lipoprotein family protein [Microvirga roseola]|uniref:ABC-type transport auxiliary lipoprotein family protein n=1 Tax=Microvirga roseola TaxID=2883126 RepID=UPI001E4EAA94|nr:ABC-type transport auxiliary lipoprotein family protein [Microvirga roseola]
MFPPKTDRARPLLRIAPVLVLAAVTAACSSTPAPTTYDLSATTTRIRGAAGVQIAVAEPTAVQPLTSEQIIVKDASGAIAALGGSQWADDLPSMIQARLVTTFENSSQSIGVVLPSSGTDVDVRLLSNLRSFQIMTPSNEAEVEIAAKIVSDQTGRIINSRIFRARLPVAAIDAANATTALNEALQVVMADIVRWVGGSNLPRRDDPEALAMSQPPA